MQNRQKKVIQMSRKWAAYLCRVRCHSPSREGTREARRTCGSSNYTFSLLSCGRWKERENVRFFELHVLSPIWWDMVSERQGDRVVLRTTHSLSCVLRDGTRQSRDVPFWDPHIVSPVYSRRQAENVRFLERHILSISWENQTAERMCGSSSRTFSLLVCGMWEARNVTL